MRVRVSKATYMIMYIALYVIGTSLMGNKITIGFIGYAIGLAGMCLWFRNKNLGLLTIAVSIVPNAMSRDLIATLSIISIILYVGVKIINGEKLDEVTKYRESKWYTKLMIISIYVSMICSYMGLNNHNTTSIIFIVTPVFILLAMFSLDRRVVIFFLTVEVITRFIINLQIMQVDGNYMGCIDSVFISLLLIWSYKNFTRELNEGLTYL